MLEPEFICGVDEAGRGPWAGPVCAGAVILSADYSIKGLADSKKLSEVKRLRLENEIQEHAAYWSLGWADAQEIDELNIRQATHLAMRRAIASLGQKPTHILIDGNDVPRDLPSTAEAIIKGDSKIPAISAASILAKCARDKLMAEYDVEYPDYGFAGHKGYGVKAHSEALSRFGPCPIHRLSFKPVAAAMKQKVEIEAKSLRA